jgi:hypothetical protein
MNIIEFKSFKEYDLVFCFVDTTPHISDGWAKEITKNQSDYTISNLYNKGYTVLQGTNEDALILKASENYKFACILSSGTEFINGEGCIDAIVNECTENFLVKGHVLDRGDAYYELHQQCFLINLINYKKEGCPAIGQQVLGSKHTQICPIRAVSNHHDDYTPLWIQPGLQEKEYKHKCHGWNILSVALKNYKVTSFNETIRNNKIHLYPESPKDFLDKLSYVYSKERYCATEFVHKNHTEWYNQELKNLRQVIAPASGEWYKPFLDITKTCTVVLYDYNLSSLEYWKNNVEKLDNVEYKFIQLDLLADKIDFKTLADISLEEDTLINLSNIFCYEGTCTLSPLKYRLEKENEIVSNIKSTMPNAWINFSARASSGYISHNNYFAKAKDLELYKISDLKKPTWHYNEWL